MTGRIGSTDDGYSYDITKMDRKVDPYMAVIITPTNYTYTGLFASIAKAAQWARKTMEQDRRNPRKPS